MICKWCGASMERSDKKCRRCGKESPAMSDCGGFYDLVPPVKSSTMVDLNAAQAGQQPAAVKKSSGPWMVIACILMVVVLVLTLLVNSTVRANQDKLDRLLNGDKSTETDDIQLGNNQEDTQPTEVEEEPKSLVEQDITINVDFDPKKPMTISAEGAAWIMTVPGANENMEIVKYTVTIGYEDADGETTEIGFRMRHSVDEQTVFKPWNDKLSEEDSQWGRSDISVFACNIGDAFGDPAEEDGENNGFRLVKILDESGNSIDIEKYTVNAPTSDEEGSTGAENKDPENNPEENREVIPVSFVSNDEDFLIVVYTNFLKDVVEGESSLRDNTKFTYVFERKSADGGTITLEIESISVDNLEND